MEGKRELIADVARNNRASRPQGRALLALEHPVLQPRELRGDNAEDWSRSGAGRVWGAAAVASEGLNKG
jgi:hypothetical protein